VGEKEPHHQGRALFFLCLRIIFAVTDVPSVTNKTRNHFYEKNRYEKKESVGGGDLEFDFSWDRVCLSGFNPFNSGRNCSFHF